MLNLNSEDTNSILDSGVFWYGVVESISDPTGNFRVKVRIFGIHNNDRIELPTSDLPWAIVANSTSSPSVNGNGRVHNLTNGSLVIGYFLDGYDSQSPVVLFSLFSKLQESVENITYNSNNDKNTMGKVFLSNENSSYPDSVKYYYNNNIPKDVLAKSQLNASLVNPIGINKVYFGKPSKVMIDDVKYSITSLGDIFNYIEIYDTDGIYLTHDIDPIIGVIPISKTTGIPRSGIIKINNEIIYYSDISDVGLTGVLHRGADNTTPTNHNRFSPVKWIYPITKNGDTPIPFSTITNNAVDILKDIRRKTNIIKGYLIWLSNSISSKLSSYLNQLLTQITSTIKSNIPGVVKNVINVILQSISDILCIFDETTVDSVIDSIEQSIINEFNNFLLEFYNKSNIALEFVESCSNKIFDAIFQYASIINSIGVLINNVYSKYNNVNIISQEFEDIKNNNVSDLSSFVDNNNVISTILDILGVSCKVVVNESNNYQYQDYSGTINGCIGVYTYTSSLKCPPNEDLIQKLNSLYKPSPLFLDVTSYGNGIKTEIDNTPGNNRYLQTYPSGSLVEYFNDGTSKLVYSNDKYQVVLGDDHLHLQGNANIVVDGDFGLTVKGNMNLTVNNQLNVTIGGNSQIEYVGGNKTIFKKDSEIIGVSKLNFGVSSFGISTNNFNVISSSIDLKSNEIILNSTGSLNLLSEFRNDITNNTFKVINNNNYDCYNFGDYKSIFSKNHEERYIGNSNVTYLSTRNLSVSGTNTEKYSSVNSVRSNMKIENVDNIYSTSSKGFYLNSDLINFNSSGNILNFATGLNLRKTENGFNVDM